MLTRSNYKIRLLLLMLSAFIVCGLLSPSVVAYADNKQANDFIQELYFDFKYDTTQVFRYNSNEIPIEFSIEGLLGDQSCSLSIESEDNLYRKSVSTSSSYEYNCRNNYVNLQLPCNIGKSTEAEYNKEKVKTVKINASSKEDFVVPCTLTLYIFESMYGTFVSYINEEQLYLGYIDWLYKNGLIGEKDYQNVTDVTVSDINDESTMLYTKSITPTEVYMTYSFKVLSGSRIKVNGTFKWTDSVGVKHPLKNAKVNLYDENSTADTLLNTGYTDSNGNYTCTISNQTNSPENGYDLYLRVYAESKAARVIKSNATNTVYKFKTPTENNILSSVGAVTKRLSASDTANAFQILQAAIVGADYAQYLSNTVQPSIDFSYPNPDSGINKFTSGHIEITSSSYYSWDVILHEYGHYIQRRYNISNNPGGTHSFGVDNIDRFISSGSSLSEGKSKGCWLAWAEGWATYFGLSSQIQQNIASMNIPGCADGCYDNFYKGFSINIESSIGKGEGDELAVAAALWDLADSSSWGGSASETFDQASFGYKTIWNTTVNLPAKTFSEFTQYIYSHSVFADIRKIDDILGKQNISATSLKTNGLTNNPCSLSSASTSPTFSWSSASGSTNCVNSYSLVIFSNTTSMNVIYEIPISVGTSATLSSSQWNNLRNNYSSGFYWCIKAKQSDSPNTGPYYSKFVLCKFS